MSMVSHLHHLFNAEQCQAYIHTLRWKDRPLQCPRCQSLNVGPWGTYHAQPGLKRYQLPAFSAKYLPEHVPGKGPQSLAGAPPPRDVRGRSGH